MVFFPAEFIAKDEKLSLFPFKSLHEETLVQTKENPPVASGDIFWEV